MGNGVVQPHFVKVSFSFINIVYFLTLLIIPIALCHDIVVNCGALVVPSGSVGGLIVNVINTIYNSTAMYYCTEVGYELIGDAERVCQASGNWSNIPPYCERE